MRLRKQELAALDLESLAYISEPEFNNWCQEQNYHNYSSWMLPQLVSVFGSWRLYKDGKTTLLENCHNDFLKGCWRLTRVPRSVLVKNQTKEPEYASFTPLILLGFKRMQGSSYEQFRGLEGLEWLLEPNLYDALVKPEGIPQLSKNRLLEIREQGLSYRTGPKAGQTRRPESTWQLYGIQGTELGDLPKYTQTMLTQCWLAHPQHRKPTMIVDPNNWDNQPSPLVTEVFSKETKATKQVVSDLPW